ncbi:MAG: 50S ribosomal protein L6 [Clostridiaceae bacterium]|jgi:large subunit ribosomal protein L6|nr:50S ribosomal protein L6 [Clostridiaceae bacterium]
MSRIGRLPIEIPQGVEIKIADDNMVSVKGPKGQLIKKMNEDLNIAIEDGKVIITRPTDEKMHRALHGLTRALLNNMVEGVSKGFEKVLEINGVGYRAAKSGKKLTLTVGYSHPVEMDDPEGITTEVPAPNRIIVKGADKEKVGTHAANIRAVREPEPYLGKGIKYLDEVIRRKEGKAGKK